MGRINEGKSALMPDGTPKLQQLRPWHKSMARMMVGGGKRPKELCTIFGMSPSQVTVITSSPLFLAEQERLESIAEYEALDMRTELEIRQGLALAAIDNGLLQGDADKAAKVGFEILDRTGFPKGAPVQKHLHLHAHKEIAEMDVDELQDEALKLITDAEEE
jgi:hypothetical protein